jgi:hypothetical protein
MSNQSLQPTAGSPRRVRSTADRRDDQLEFMKHIIDVGQARCRPPEGGS